MYVHHSFIHRLLIHSLNGVCYGKWHNRYTKDITLPFPCSSLPSLLLYIALDQRMIVYIRSPCTKSSLYYSFYSHSNKTRSLEKLHCTHLSLFQHSHRNYPFFLFAPLRTTGFFAVFAVFAVFSLTLFFAVLCFLLFPSHSLPLSLTFLLVLIFLSLNYSI
ncbi:MAG: hypothetical protein BYD32DRAFT_235885 [Podila humilis]|nr:MAG: hypothetical protein BYD32DRAFT_235885 [Podila humilis]